MRKFLLVLFVVLLSPHISIHAQHKELSEAELDSITQIAFEIGKKMGEETRRKAENGDEKAQHTLGVLFESQKDYTTAFYWYEKAAIQGNSESQLRLAHLYYHGLGVIKNITMANNRFIVVLYLCKILNSHGARYSFT
jgi:hypothetical protein